MNATEVELIDQISIYCNRISKGDYSCIKELEELSIEGRYPKIITELAESFSFMLVKLESREFQLKETIKELEYAKALLKKKNISLKKEVHTLKIEIDRIKQSQEVSEISTTDFFQDIKRKSKKRRKNKKP